MMKKTSMIPLIVLAFVGAFVWSVPAFAADVIKIGLIYSLSGPGAAIGVGQMEGGKMAIEEINAAGGINIGGKQFKLEAVARDDETKPDVAIGRFKEMVKDQGVTAVVGGTFGHVSMALNEETKKSGGMFMATNGVPEDFFKKAVKSPTSLCIVAAAEWAGRGAAAYMSDQMKAKRISCFMPDYAIGKGTFKGFQEIIKDRPGVSYETIWHPVGSPDMTSFLIKALEYKPDVLFVGSWGGDAINALKQALETGAGKKAQIFHFWLMNAFATGIPANAIKGVRGQMFWYHDMRGFHDAEVVKASEEFTKKYVATHKEPPEVYTMTSYFGVMETVRAMRLAGSTDPKKMHAALMANPEWRGAKGAAKWREDGTCIYKYSTWIVEGKGPEDRKSDRYPEKFDYARIVDVYAGDAYVPSMKSLGY
jgi:branched-chain amino acid transport system substrate-binding protein